MSILTVLQEVSSIAGLSVSSQVFGSSDPTHIELTVLANECAEMVARAHDWQAITVEVSMVGNGIEPSLPLPTDFDRLRENTRLWNFNTNIPLIGVRDAFKWHELSRRDPTPVYARWIILNKEVIFNPPIPNEQTVKFFYISNRLVEKPNGNMDIWFTSDTDEFRLDERLLRLAIIWKWKMKNALPFDGDKAEYDRLLASLVATDKGTAPVTATKAA